MERTHLTSLQCYLQEPKSRKPMISWHPGAVFARFQKAVTLSRVLAPCCKTSLRSCTTAEGTETPDADGTFPARHKAGRQTARGSKSADQAATWQKGIQCEADKSPNRNGRKEGTAALWPCISGNRMSDTGHWLHEPKAMDPLFQLDPTPSSHWATAVPLREHCPSHQAALIIPYIQPS